MDKDSAAQVPASRKSKNALVKTHKAHLKTLGSDPDADRPVKQPILEDGYQASTKSIRDLDIVRHTISVQDEECGRITNTKGGTNRCRWPT